MWWKFFLYSFFSCSFQLLLCFYLSKLLLFSNCVGNAMNFVKTKENVKKMMRFWKSSHTHASNSDGTRTSTKSNSHIMIMIQVSAFVSFHLFVIFHTESNYHHREWVTKKKTTAPVHLYGAVVILVTVMQHSSRHLEHIKPSGWWKEPCIDFLAHGNDNKWKIQPKKRKEKVPKCLVFATERNS